MKYPTRQQNYPLLSTSVISREKICSMYHYHTHAAAALEFLHRGISLCRTVFTQVFLPDHEEGENGGMLSLHISWSVKTVALTASTRYLHDWHIQLVAAVPKAINSVKKII